MKKLTRNLILLVAVAAVGLMSVGILVYNYIPTDVAIAKPNTYEVDIETTKVLSDATESSNLLSQITGSSSGSDEIKTSIILQTYQVTKTDLARYKASGAYVSGKSDPFSDAPEPTVEENNDGNTNTSSTKPGNTNNTVGGSTVQSDGTLLNSASKK